MSNFTYPPWQDTVLKLFIAMVLCGAIGIERELRGQPAGFRTHILVGLGSTLLMMISIVMGGQQWDPARVAAQIVTGIGFLGAGAIIRQHEAVRGLTTAASIWGVSAIGMAIGMGWYEGAIGTALMILVALIFLKVFEKTMTLSRHDFRIHAAASVKSHEELRQSIGSLDYRVQTVHWGASDDAGMQWVDVEILMPRKDEALTQEIVEHFTRCPGVERVEGVRPSHGADTHRAYREIVD